MAELLQTRSVVDMVVARRGCSEGYARLMIFRAVKSRKLKTYQKQLKYGTRSISLFDPKDVFVWLDKAKTNNKNTLDK